MVWVDNASKRANEQADQRMALRVDFIHTRREQVIAILPAFVAQKLENLLDRLRGDLAKQFASQVGGGVGGTLNAGFRRLVGGDRRRWLPARLGQFCRRPKPPATRTSARPCCCRCLDCPALPGPRLRRRMYRRIHPKT